MSEDKADYNPTDALLNLKGKAYLPVAARIVWFRNDYPEGQIETTIISIDDKQAIFRARVATGQGGVAEATGTETPRDFGDYIEKAETKAVGRALGYLGYGTASAGFEEGQRIVDAPQPLTSPKPARTPAPPQTRQDAPGATERPPQVQSVTPAPPDAAQTELPAAPPLTDAGYKKLFEQAMTDAQFAESRDEVRLIRKALEERDKAATPASYAG